MLGIVIANWNGEKLIGNCLESLKNQIYKNFTIYIVDNGSKDKSIEIIESYKSEINIKLTKLNYNSGFAKANNIGINKAINDGCNYILTLNNDIEVKNDCLLNVIDNINKYSKDFDVYQIFMVNYYDRDKCDAIGIKFNKRLYVKQLGFGEDVKHIIDRDEFEIDGACAGAAIYSAKSLLDIRLNNGDFFDSNFFAYYEDVDLALRLKNKGYKTKFLKNSIVYHMHSMTGGKSNGFKEYYLSRNFIIYSNRNQSKEEFNANRKIYVYGFVKQIIKNITSPRISFNIMKGIISGTKELKRYKNNYF